MGRLSGMRKFVFPPGLRTATEFTRRPAAGSSATVTTGVLPPTVSDRFCDEFATAKTWAITGASAAEMLGNRGPPGIVV